MLTLITFAFLVLMLLVVKGVGGRSRVSFQAQQQALGAMNGYIEEMVEGQKVIKVFNHESKRHRAVLRAERQRRGRRHGGPDLLRRYDAGHGQPRKSRIDYAVTCCVAACWPSAECSDVGSLARTCCM